MDALETLSQACTDGYSSLNLVTLWRTKLEDHCRANSLDSELVASLRGRARVALEKRKLTHSWYLMSVCLDPRFKKLKMLSQDLRESTYSKLREIVSSDGNAHISGKRKLESEARDSKAKTTPDKGTKRPKLSDSVPKAFNEYLDSSAADDQGKDEVEDYLNMDVGQIEPTEFWEENGLRFPRLKQLAQKLVAVPAVPAFCHLLSNGSDFPVKRKSVIGKNLDQILFLHTFFATT
jgi:hypothetical protein